MQRPIANDFDHASLEAMMERYRAELLRYQRATPPGKPTLAQNFEASERGRTTRTVTTDNSPAAQPGTEVSVRPAPAKAEGKETTEQKKGTQPETRRERVLVDTPPVMLPTLTPRLNTVLPTEEEVLIQSQTAVSEEDEPGFEAPRPPVSTNPEALTANFAQLPAPERQAQALSVTSSGQRLSPQQLEEVPKLAGAPIPQSVIDSATTPPLQNALGFFQPTANSAAVPPQPMTDSAALPQAMTDSAAAPPQAMTDSAALPQAMANSAAPSQPMANSAAAPMPQNVQPLSQPVFSSAVSVPQAAQPPVQSLPQPRADIRPAPTPLPIKSERAVPPVEDLEPGCIAHTEFEKGIGAYGVFRPYERMGRYTLASFLQTPGEAVQTLVRFAADLPAGSADAIRCRRSFTVKFFCREGEYDLFGMHLPVSVGATEKTLSDCCAAARANPKTGLRTRSAFWEFLVTHREALHAALWLYSDLGTIGSYRTIDGYGLPCLWVNTKNERRAVRPRWLSRQRPQTLTRFEAEELAGSDPDAVARDLIQSLQSGERPQFELSIQIIEPEQFSALPFDPFDPTAIWPTEQFKPQRIGLLTLERLPDDAFAELDAARFKPENIIPGIEHVPAPAMKKGDDFTQVRQYLRSLGEFSRRRLMDNLSEELLRLPPLLLEQVLILFSQADLEFGQAMTLALGG